MGEVQLDIVSSDATLPECLALMKQAKRRAIVVESGGELTLIAAEAITNAMNQAVEQKQDPTQVKVATVRPHMFNEQDNGHTLSRTLDKNQLKARVTTLSEMFARSLGSSMTICNCAGPAPDFHTFTRDQVQEEGVCNYPHKAALTCDEI